MRSTTRCRTCWCRFERMRGRDVLWQPGTDHAGIATQMVVERQLMERQEPPRARSGAKNSSRRCGRGRRSRAAPSSQQLKRLGASCDWSRERFTMDEGSRARCSRCSWSFIAPASSTRTSGWSTGTRSSLTAISDLEVQQVEVKGHLWHFRYPLEGARSGRSLDLHHRRDHAAGDHARRHRGRGASRRRALPASRRQARDPAAGRPAHSRSSPMNIPIRRKAPARSRSRRRTTSTISRSAGGTICRCQRARCRSAAQARGNEAFLRDVPGSPELERDLALCTASIASSCASRSSQRLEAAGLLAKTEPHAHTVPHGDRSAS